MDGKRKRKVLIVGGSRGLGLALAADFRRRSCQSVILSRTAPCESVDVSVILEDAARVGVAEKYLRQVEPDLLVINFAEGIYKQIEFITDEEARQNIEINAAGAISWMNAAIRLLPAGAKIGWVASLTALIPDENWAIYAAMKAAVNHYIECIRPAAARRGISITVCYPGCLQTDFHRAAGAATHAPLNAVLPGEIVAAMSEAIESGEEVWAAAMDVSTVERYYEMRKRFLIETEGAIK